MSILIISSEEFFRPIVKEAIQNRKLKTNQYVEEYIVNLLQFFIDSRNFTEISNKTLAEIYLESTNAEYSKKLEMLKKLGDISLYISGIFSEFIQKKIVGIDYYVNMGRLAYSSLITQVPKERAVVYREISKSFIEYVDVLTYIRYKHFSKLDKNKDLLSLYDKYIKTGSTLSRDFLTELGFVIPNNLNNNQQ